MDDPWGSPWASTDTGLASADGTGTGTSTSFGTPGPKPPQPALLSLKPVSGPASGASGPASGVSGPAYTPHAIAPTLSFSTLNDASPWADDGDFGDWEAPAPPASSLHAASNPWDYDDRRLSPRPTRKPSQSSQSSLAASPSPGPLASGSGSGSGTNSTPTRPPGVLTSRSRASSTLSRASSDPWGRDDADRRRPKSELDDTMETNGVQIDVAEDDDKSSFASFEEADSRDREMQDAPEPVSATSDGTAKPDGDTSDVAEREKDADDADDAKDTDGAPSSTDDHTDSRTASRSGSQAGHDTDADRGQHDSPTTSLDADDADERNEMNENDGNENDGNKNDDETHDNVLRRKASTKVQGLVELFDGLARRPVSSSSSLSRPASRSASGTRSVSVERSRDPEMDGDRRPSRQLSIKELPVPSPLPEADEESGDDDVVPVSPDHAPEIQVEVVDEADEADTTADAAKTEADTKRATQTDGLSPARLLDLYGPPTPYTVDAALVDSLFRHAPPGRTTTYAADDPSVFIPEGYILDDSFTSSSERRTWYRVSRTGSARRHETADYRPVTWATSTVRPETVKIVRRWMEEDSFTGKPTLGGAFLGFGAGGGSMFGWDSTAAPVALDQAFKKPVDKNTKADKTDKTDKDDKNKKGHVHARTPSAAAEGAAAAPAKDKARHSVHIGAFAVPEDNVWAASEQPEAPANQHRRTRSSFELPPPPRAAPRPSPLSLSMTPEPQTEPAKDDAADDDADDDEWGEMVMSPTAPEGFAPALPLPLPTSTLQPAPSLPPVLPPVLSPIVPAPAKTVSFVSNPRESLDASPRAFSSAGLGIAGGSPDIGESDNTDVSDVPALVDEIVAQLPDLTYMSR